MQRGWLRVVTAVIVGIIWGWGGYWLGHLAGWSTDADWPTTIGGGTGAILLSIGLAVVGSLVTIGVLTWWSRRREN
jgi:Zn-dependent protease with chaperone function